MKIEEVSKLYKEFRVPLHVQEHMRKVSEVCSKLSDALSQKGIKVDKEKVMIAALAHDVLRVCDFLEFNPENFPNPVTDEDINKWKELREKYGDKGHVKAMVEVLEHRGEPEIANLIKKHGFYEIDNLKTWEEKIIYYADKRVDGDEIVDLERRFHEGKKRNLKENEINEKLLETEEKVKRLEKEFISVIGELPV